MGRPSWYYRLDEQKQYLYDQGARFRALASADEFEPDYVEFDWVRGMRATAKKQAVRYDKCLENLNKDATIMSTSAEVDSLAMSLAVKLALAALRHPRERLEVKFFDLGRPGVMRRIRSLIHQDELDVAIGWNAPLSATWDRIEIARDFISLQEGFRILVTVGEPRQVAGKLGTDRFAGVFYQSSVFERNGTTVVKRKVGSQQR